MSSVKDNGFQSDEEDIQAELDAIQGADPFVDDEFDVQDLKSSEFFNDDLDANENDNINIEKQNINSVLDKFKNEIKQDLANGGKKTKIYAVSAMFVLLIFIAILVSVVSSVFSPAPPINVKEMSTVNRSLDSSRKNNNLKNLLAMDSKETSPNLDEQTEKINNGRYGEDQVSNAKVLSAIKMLNRKINDSEVRTNSLVSALNDRVISLGADVGDTVSMKVSSELNNITNQLDMLSSDTSQLKKLLLGTRKELQSLVVEAEKIIDDRAKLTGFSLTGINSYGGRMEAIVNDGGNDVPVQQGGIYKGWRLSSMQMTKGATFCSISSLICTTLHVQGEGELL